jgi:hypothetical protein
VTQHGGWPNVAVRETKPSRDEGEGAVETSKGCRRISRSGVQSGIVIVMNNECLLTGTANCFPSTESDMNNDGKCSGGEWMSVW